jgi:endonuclease YncB( thermonuclease family)
MGICTMLGLCSALITGAATVHDGDTIYVNHQAIRLWGVDAEELSEPKGAAARNVLRDIIGTANVVCRPVGDSHGRTVAKCTVGRDDIGALLVIQGAALDCARYSGGAYRKLEPATSRGRLKQKPYCNSTWSK